jgi:membrane protein implicated in regulation of membrane protease activity
VSIAYLAALIVGLGTLLVQVAFGARGGGHHDLGGGVHHLGGAGHAGGGHGHGDAHATGKPGASAVGFFAVFLSFRFWIFAALGFGLGGSVLHLTGALAPTVEGAVAAALGLASGLGAALAFRAAATSSVGTPSEASRAVGGVARVVVPLGKDAQGKIRIEIGGSSVDLIATTDDEALARDEMVLVEDVTGGIARVSRRPRELE